MFSNNFISPQSPGNAMESKLRLAGGHKAVGNSEIKQREMDRNGCSHHLTVIILQPLADFTLLTVLTQAELPLGHHCT
jgi:hypothetical protein